MFPRLIVRLLTAALLAAASLRGEEHNGWPFFVRHEQADGQMVSEQFVGPLFFAKHGPAEIRGFRPFYLQTRVDDQETSSFLYPLFTWRKQAGYTSFSFYQLVNDSREQEVERAGVHHFDVWPFYFSRDTGDPATSYQAFFPFGGTIKQRLGKDRIHFVAFPLYSFVEKGEKQTTHAPWPFLRFIGGGGYHGFEFWPLFGRQGRDGDYDRQFYLWPLIYKSATHLSEPEPDVKFGVLPFYTRDTGPGYISENYVWPFFGYTHRTLPKRYDERRYLWPFLVQGRGDTNYVNRWAPLYTHSVIKGYDKTWAPWPIYRHATWTDGDIAQEKNVVFFFLYWSLTQRSTTNPAAAPAHKTHLWPLFSSWDNGAGRHQVQFLSPLEIFFPTNEPVRQLYTPLFALYRYDQRAPGDTRHVVLWNLLSWENTPTEREFHLGPLFSVRSTPGRSRVAVGNGLLCWQRAPGDPHWKFSLFDFRPKPDNKAPEVPSP